MLLSQVAKNYYDSMAYALKCHCFKLSVLTLICLLKAADPVLGQKIHLAKPLEQGHSHNDYWRTNPLIDALQLGFKSVEADVFLSNGTLLVGHSAEELQPDRTLERLYLAPLQTILQKEKKLYRRSGILYLYIDFKTDGPATYAQLVPLLEKYRALLVTPQAPDKKRGVRIILTGNYPRALVLADPQRLVYLDGKIEDLALGLDAEQFPVVSGNWANYFKWTGSGTMPVTEKEFLNKLNRQAGQSKVKIRFWNISEANPDSTRTIWRELLKHKTLLIGTDHLNWLTEELTPN